MTEGAPLNYTLICASHDRLGEFIHEPIKAGMFNLGYLPGGQEVGITTRRVTTLPAIRAALDILAPDGILLVAVYPGHEEGRLEGEAIAEYAATLSRYQICASRFQLLNSPAAPYFYIFEKALDRPLRRPGRAAKNAARAARLADRINQASRSVEELTTVAFIKDNDNLLIKSWMAFCILFNKSRQFLNCRNNDLGFFIP